MLTHWLQSDMRGKQTGQVHLPDAGKEAFEVCLGFMYGRLETISPDLLLPVFQLADAHQVSTCFCSPSAASQRTFARSATKRLFDDIVRLYICAKPLLVFGLTTLMCQLLNIKVQSGMSNT